MTSDIDTLVSDLQLELDLLERVFTLTSPNEEDATARRLSIFKQAEIDADKEELQDKLNSLIIQAESFDQHVISLQSNIMDLKKKNDELQEENENLRNKMANSSFRSLNNDSNNKQMYSDEDYKTLEFKFAETKGKLARIQQVQDDQLLAKEVLEKELDMEQSKRILAEKERDAYIAAYEVSLKHFEKWTKTKILRK